MRARNDLEKALDLKTCREPISRKNLRPSYIQGKALSYEILLKQGSTMSSPSA